MKKNAPDDDAEIQALLNKLVLSMLRDWDESPEMYATADKIKLVQYIGMYVSRKSRWETTDEPDTGSAIQRYTGAFKTPHAAGGGKKRVRSAAVPALAYDADADASGDDPDF